MRLEIKLAQLVMKKVKFIILLPVGSKLVWYTTAYTLDPIKLELNTIIGHIVVLNDGPSLVISKIEEQIFKTDEHFALDWPSDLVTTPIQHNWDTRKLEELPVHKFYIPFDNIQCHFLKYQAS